MQLDKDENEQFCTVLDSCSVQISLLSNKLFISIYSLPPQGASVSPATSVQKDHGK